MTTVKNGSKGGNVGALLSQLPEASDAHRDH